MKYSIPLLLAATVGFCVASPAHGQQLTRRSGLWISGGVDIAYTTIECGVWCNTDAGLGPVGVVQIGGTPSQKASIALELSYWRTSADTSARDYGLAMALIKYHPLPGIPLFLKFGGGVGRYGEERSPAEGAPWALSANGFAFQVGAGYEFPLLGRLNIGPTVSFVSALGHKAKRNRLAVSDMTGKWFRLGAQVTWQ